MAKVNQTVSLSQCDFCGAAMQYMDSCNGCGKDICYECEKVNAFKYPHGVFVGGSGDGLYCKDCDERLGNAGDPLLLAFREVRSLRTEMMAREEEFSRRRKAAEAALAAIPRK